ncbi:MAG: low molecular weight protein tyrosine phosphatase family protein [Gammaproteobacteria bacterium]
MNLLFVCSENRLRSPTAEDVFQEYPNVEAIGAGTNADCATPVSGDLIEWADAILVMERSHRNKIAKKFRPLLKGKKLAVLDIPDDFERGDPVLVRLLKSRVPRYVNI